MRLRIIPHKQPSRTPIHTFRRTHYTITTRSSHLGDIESWGRRSDLKDGWAVENHRIHDGAGDVRVGDECVCLTHRGSGDSGHNHATLHGTSNTGSAESADEGDEESRWHRCSRGECEGDAWCSRDTLGGGQSRECHDGEGHVGGRARHDELSSQGVDRVEAKSSAVWVSRGNFAKVESLERSVKSFGHKNRSGNTKIGLACNERSTAEVGRCTNTKSDFQRQFR